jgi:Zn-dependent protease with chaperone function
LRARQRLSGELAGAVCQNGHMAVTKTQFPRDPGLQSRMILTMFLLGALYVVFVGVLFAAGVNAGFIVIIAVGLSVAQLFTSDKLALHAMGARVVTPAEAPELHAMIERLCIQADLPKPKVAVAQTDMPNAFAIGRSQKAATVCVVYAVSFFLMMALSRYREFAADRGAALITGRPSALASALRKLASGIERLPQQDLRAANELSAFFIAAPTKQSIMGLFATHPPMDKRIEALARLEAELQRGTLAAA